jgi:PAS domain S-box-containing protein
MSNLESVATEPGCNPAAAPCALASVLVIDDEEIVCNTLSVLLRAGGFEVVTARSGEEGVELLRGRQFEVAITDLAMSGMDGIRTMAALKEVDPDVQVIILTGYETVESIIAALRQGACDFLLKPIGMAQLRPALMRALDRRRPKAALPVHGASRTVLATLNREDLIPAILTLAQRTMRAGAAGLALVPFEGVGMRVDLSDDHGPFTEAVAESIAQIAMQADEPLRDPSLEATPSQNGDAGIPAGSVLAYPLDAGNASLGALVLWRDQGVAKFSAFDVQRGRLLADEIVIALVNARLSRELSRKVEELKAAHGELARAEARAGTGIESAREAIIVFDREGVVRDFNPMAEQIFGWSRQQTLGRNLADFAIPPRLLEVFRKHLETAYRVGKDPLDKCLEVYALRQNGEEFPLEVSTTVIETPQGKLLSAFARDISERKRAEQSLREAEERFRSLFTSDL